ncbi:C3H1-type domain-containing protein [Caenorhabditis elegans]|uniref:C3H1-type domain-containing protein n=2 Tax=Caenorhabditis elegans TaxID=6239 RepID=G5ECB9_CAEEL|nr:C3H1-type domain-containing protein [Caenorhabditis elegans]AAC47486.1 MEX-1 [Caenorhabditis elegans]CAA91362.2 C3H1-type domain-containing protein [Caenorhabditis elegans]|eukprot:NP_001254325.1 Muscle EXcess [Caenorhabditis elegans]
MQSSNGEHHQQKQTPYFMNAPCDPALLALAQQTFLGFQPQKNMYQHGFPPMLPHRNLIPSLAAAIPEMDKLMLEEPIEAGSMPYRRATNKNISVSDDSFNNMHRSSSSSQYRRHSAQWETMTDDERESVQRQKRKEEAFKTALCDAFKRSGSCPYGEACRFAHGENELRMPSQPRGKAHPKYKTQLCDKFSNFGQCPYGPRCQFIHKLKKGLPLSEYNRALQEGEISPARDDEITNPDESSSQVEDLSELHHRQHQQQQQYQQRYRRPPFNNFHDMSDSGYSAPRRRLHHQFEHLGSEQQQQQQQQTPAPKIVYPSMQVVNIEMATGDGPKRSDNHHYHHHHHQRRHIPAPPSTGPLSSLIDQADYEASMASGKMFGKPENIRTYGAMIRANEEHVERNQTGVVKKERATVLPKRDLSLIREEDTLLVDGSHLNMTSSAILPAHQIPSTTTTSTSSPVQEQPWYEKIFGKMTMIQEESSMGGEDDDAHEDHYSR